MIDEMFNSLFQQFYPTTLTCRSKLTRILTGKNLKIEISIAQVLN